MNEALVLFLPAAGAAIAAYVFMRFVHRKRDARPDSSILTVTADDRAFTLTDSRKIKSLDVRWQDVVQVTLIRTDKGPFDDALFYHVVFGGGEITLPAGANNIQAFVEHLSAQAGFDRTAFETAMRSVASDSYSRIFTA